MPALKYRVTLTEDEKEMLEGLRRKGKNAARKQTRARILLKSAEGCSVDEIVKALAIRGKSRNGGACTARNVLR